MTRLGGVLLAISVTTAGAAVWACGFGGCELATCSGGFQLSLRVDQIESNPITLDIEAENGRTTWECDPGNSRCTRRSSIDGDRDFDVEVNMVVATIPFGGLPCDAAACINIEIRGENDDADDPGTYGPEMVVVSIIGEDGEEFSQDFAPEYDRTDDYGGEGCGYCDSRESFDERAAVD